MTWKEVIKFDERDADSRVQKTGYCRRCQKVVTKYQKCPLSLPSPDMGVKPSCPMRETNKGDEEKMTGAVSSTTVGMESRPLYSNKKEEEDNA